MKALGIFIFLSFLLNDVYAAKGYPKIKQVIGNVSLIDKSGVKKKLNLKTLLVEKAEFFTEKESYLTLELDPVRTLVIQENTHVKLPGISWDTGEVPFVILNKGEIRWKQSEDSNYKIVISSALFEFIAPKGDYYLKINPEAAYAEIRLVQGYFEFSALNGDEVASLQSRQKVSFQGVLENNEIAYDVLLKGKKVPRGKLSAVESFSKAEEAYFNTEINKQKHLEQLEKQKKQADLENLKKQGFICLKPQGQLLNCYYKCKCSAPLSPDPMTANSNASVSCVEYKCTASGEWKMTRSIYGNAARNQCEQVKGKVGSCVD